jgi:hypothetical protein
MKAPMLIIGAMRRKHAASIFAKSLAMFMNWLAGISMVP